MNLGDVCPTADFGLALRRVAIAFHRHRLAAARAAFGIGAREAAALGEVLGDAATALDRARQVRAGDRRSA